MADLCRQYHARFQRQVSNLRVSQSSWDHSPMRLIACSAMGQKQTLDRAYGMSALLPRTDTHIDASMSGQIAQITPIWAREPANPKPPQRDPIERDHRSPACSRAWRSATWSSALKDRRDRALCLASDHSFLAQGSQAAVVDLTDQLVRGHRDYGKGALP